MKVIIAGGRDFRDAGLLRIECDRILDGITDIEIVSGTASGADILGELYAKFKSFNIKRFPANWDLYGKGAGFIRNSEMADYADMLIAFWDGKSKGTKNMISVAERKGLTVHIIKY